MATTISPDEARSAYEALVAKHDLHVEELDDTRLSEDLRGYHMGHLLQLKGHRDTLVLPLGQDPVARLVATHRLLRHLGREA